MIGQSRSELDVELEKTENVLESLPSLGRFPRAYSRGQH
jgi:hypothetical protein